MMVSCPHCGAPLNLAGLPPGSSLPCTCGQMVVVPGAPAAGVPGAQVSAAAPRKKRSTLATVAIVAAVGFLPCVFIVGVLAAIAIPNFLKFQARAKQAEVKVHLKSWYTAMHAAQADRPPEEWSELLPLGVVGFAPPENNRYACWSSLEGETAEPGDTLDEATGFSADTRRFPEVTPDALGELVVPGLEGECPECGFTFACAANIDNDPTLDVWSVGTQDRTTTDGKTIPAGEPFHQLDDVAE
jgi:type IV pilus assembly protein PilA